jgi:hypothetical protein
MWVLYAAFFGFAWLNRYLTFPDFYTGLDINAIVTMGSTAAWGAPLLFTLIQIIVLGGAKVDLS